MKKIIQNLVLCAGLFLFASMGTAFAASSYTVTETDATVGTNASLEIEYTVDTAAQTWAEDDTLTIQVPANFPQWASTTFTAEVDGDTTNDGTAETAITTGLGVGKYIIAGDMLQISWGALAGNWVVVNGSTTIRVLITAGNAPTYADATSTFTFGGATVAADTDPVGLDDVNAAAAVSTASVTLGTNSVVGVAGSTTINLTVPFALDTGDTIDITFPSYVDITGDAEVPTGTFLNTLAFSCDDSSQVLTCTATGGTASSTSGTLVLTGITTRYAGTTDITVFEIENGGVSANDIAIAAAATLTDGTAATSLTGLTADASSVSTVADSTGAVAVTLTFPTVLAATDTIKLTFPANYNLSTMTTPNNGVLAATIGLDNNVNVTVSGQEVTITLLGAQGATLETITLEANTITPYYADSAQNIAVLIEQNSAGAGGADVAASAANTGINVTAGTTTAHAANASVTLANAVANGEGTVTIGLSTGLDLAINDTITMTMPAWINVPTGAIAVTSESFDGLGTFTCAGVNGTRVVTCTATGAITAGASKNIVLTATTDLTAMYAHTSTTTDITDFAVNDNSNSNKDISSDATVAVTTTTVGTLASTNIAPLTLQSGVESANTITFTTTTTIPNLGIIAITYPSGFGVGRSSGVTATSLSGLDGTWTVTVSGQVVTLTQTGGGASAAGAKSLVIPQGIVAPSATGSAGTYTITTKIAAGSEIETDAAVTADTISGGQSSDSGETHTPATTTTTTATTTTTTTDTTTTDATTEDTTTDTTTTDTETPTEVTTSTGETITLNDISDHWGKTNITDMVSTGVVKGDPSGDFRPDGNLNRAEAAAMLYRVLGLSEPATPVESPFSDVAFDEWYAGYIAYLKDLKIVGGNPDGSYKPANDINRAEFLKMAMATYYYVVDATKKAEIDGLETGAMTTAYQDLNATDWFASKVTAATELGFVGGKDCTGGKCFDAGADITRAEATKILHGMFYDMLAE